MVLKKGRFGQFLACSGYPDCKTHQATGRGAEAARTFRSKRSARVASNMVKKFGRYGEFVACSNYPTCKYVKQKTIGVKCPNCSEGEVVERRSKRGKTFLRLQPLSRLRFRGVGQADSGEMSGVRRQLPDREIPEGRRVRAVPQRRVQVQEAS